MLRTGISVLAYDLRDIQSFVFPETLSRERSSLCQGYYRPKTILAF